MNVLSDVVQNVFSNNVNYLDEFKKKLDNLSRIQQTIESKYNSENSFSKTALKQLSIIKDKIVGLVKKMIDLQESCNINQTSVQQNNNTIEQLNNQIEQCQSEMQIQKSKIDADRSENQNKMNSLNQQIKQLQDSKEQLFKENENLLHEIVVATTKIENINSFLNTIEDVINNEDKTNLQKELSNINNILERYENDGNGNSGAKEESGQKNVQEKVFTKQKIYPKSQTGGKKRKTKRKQKGGFLYNPKSKRRITKRPTYSTKSKSKSKSKSYRSSKRA
jgi:chromosome segregation ATPase